MPAKKPSDFTGFFGGIWALNSAAVVGPRWVPNLAEFLAAAITGDGLSISSILAAPSKTNVAGWKSMLWTAARTRTRSR